MNKKEVEMVVTEVVKQVLLEEGKVKEDTQINSNNNLHSLGMESISYIKIIAQLEERYDVMISDELLQAKKAETIQSIVEMCLEQMEQ